MFSRTTFAKSNPLKLRISGLLMIAVLCCAERANAQDEPIPGSAQAVDNRLKPGLNLVHKNPDTGEVTIVPGFDGESLQSAMDRSSDTEVTPFDFLELRITGAIDDDDLARLKVVARVKVNRSDQRVTVPVGFGDFLVQDWTHTSKDKGRGWPNAGDLPTKNWTLSGAGEHILTFEAIAEVRKNTNGQSRIRLAVPVAPTSSLTLNFSQPIENAQLSNEKMVYLKRDKDTNTSLLKTWELSQQTELTWTRQITEQQQETVNVRATSTTMQLDLTTDPGSLAIEQKLAISGGSLEQLQITLPEKFTQVSISGEDADGNEIITDHNPIKSDSPTRLVRFREPITGPITLSYDLGLEQRSYPQQIPVTMPNVRGATYTAGTLEVFVPYGLDVKLPVDIGTRRGRLASDADDRTAAFAYRLLSTDSRLELAVSETEAFYSVAPLISLRASREERLLELIARFKVNVVRGSRSNLVVNWPEYFTSGWQIEDSRLITGEQSTPITGYAVDESVDEYKVEFPERQSGQFEVELRAFCSLDTVQQVKGVISLPDIATPTSHSSVVSLIESDTDSIVLQSPGTQAPFPQLPGSRWPESLQKSSRPVSVWLVASPREPVQLKIEAQQPEVRVDMSASLSVVNDSIAVRQVLTYDVRHDDLSEFRLSLPNIKPVVQLPESNVSLTPDSTNGTLATYSLPTPRRGRFDVVVSYFHTPKLDTVSQAEPVPVPLALPASSEGTVQSVVVATNDDDTLSVADDDNWTRVHRDEYAAAWSNSKVADFVPLKIRRGLRVISEARPRFVVLKSAIVGKQLLTSVSGIYDADTKVALFSVAPQAQLDAAAVDGERVIPEMLTTPEDGRSLVQVRTDNVPATGSVRVIRLVLRQPLSQQHRLFSICQPELPAPAGDFGSSCNAVWVLSRTTDQSLFGFGQRLTTVGGGVWNRLTGGHRMSVRESLAAVLSPYDGDTRGAALEEIQSGSMPDQGFETMVGNVYRSAPVLVVMSRSDFYLLVSVIALLTYILCLRLTIARLILTVGILTVVVAGVVSITPTALHMLMLNLLPWCVVAAAAAFLQRYLTKGSPAPFQSLGDADGNTIFSQAQPMPESSALTV